MAQHAPWGVNLKKPLLLNFSDMNQTQWSGKGDNDGEKYREMSYTISLTHPMGPKHSSTNETQVC